MGSSKKHKKHKSERREKYEEYSNNMDPAQLQRGLKLILKVGSSSTPEYMGNSPHATNAGPPTAAEAMMSAAPSSPMFAGENGIGHEYRERHKKSKKKKKKKDREKKHKHHKEKRHRNERHDENHHINNETQSDCNESAIKQEAHNDDEHEDNKMDIDLNISNNIDAISRISDNGITTTTTTTTAAATTTTTTTAVAATSIITNTNITTNSNINAKSAAAATMLTAASTNATTTTGKTTTTTTTTNQHGVKIMKTEDDSSQDGFSFMDDDDNSQPLPENLLYYANMTTDNSPSCRPITKPIIQRKIEESFLGSPASSSLQSSSLGVVSAGAVSPTKPLAELLIPSPTASTAASTPGGASSLACLTPKPLDGSKTPSSVSSESGREPRTCVLKLKQQKSPLNKLLDHLLRFLEKRDPHQFFAWPVTDDIAPGYSTLITKPMDFSTMRQKIDDIEYSTLVEFTDDFKLMCENAVRYNHIDTVYHKAAKRLLQLGTKYLTSESLKRSLKPLSGYLRELTTKELGFELTAGDLAGLDQQGGCSLTDSADEYASIGADDQLTPAQLEEEEKRRILRLENEPRTRFEPYVDDLTSEEILEQVQNAAQAAKKRLTAKERAHQMGFMRQNKDGTTSLNLLIKEENEGPERVVTIGEIVGKLETGTGQLYGLREDKRNDAKLVKPLNYGAFASFAPNFDSRFSNLSVEETKLVLATYGDATSAEYAESILQFTKDSSYASMLANGLLDLLTNGEHSKSMAELYDLQLQNYEEHEIQKCFLNSHATSQLFRKEEETREQIEEEYEKYKNTRIDFTKLRTLKDIGIEIDFLDTIESEMKNFELTRRLQEHLSNNLSLIEKLRATQHERLSAQLPQHLAYVPQAGQDELHLAHQITTQLTDICKKLPPSSVTDPYSLRKAMGMSYVGLPPPQQTIPRVPVPEILQQPVAMPQLHLPVTATTTTMPAATMATLQNNSSNSNNNNNNNNNTSSSSSSSSSNGNSNNIMHNDLLNHVVIESRIISSSSSKNSSSTSNCNNSNNINNNNNNNCNINTNTNIINNISSNNNNNTTNNNSNNNNNNNNNTNNNSNNNNHTTNANSILRTIPTAIIPTTETNGEHHALPPMDIDDDDDDVVGGSSGVDLENELREFLESGTGLHGTSTADDNNIVAQLLLN